MSSSNVVEYKGYQGSIEVSIDDGILYGSILHINDLVTYEAETPKELQIEFEAAVDHYLSYCEEKGIEADKPFSGSFNVRIGRDLHRRLTHQAKREGLGINEITKTAISEYLKRHNEVQEFHHYHHHHHHHEVTGAFPMHMSAEKIQKPKMHLISDRRTPH